MCYFSTLKMLQFALALIKTKNRHLFDQFVNGKIVFSHFLMKPFFTSPFMCQIHDSFQEPSQMLTHNKTSGSFVMIQKSNDHFKTR